MTDQAFNVSNITTYTYVDIDCLGKSIQVLQLLATTCLCHVLVDNIVKITLAVYKAVFSFWKRKTTNIFLKGIEDDVHRRRFLKSVLCYRSYKKCHYPCTSEQYRFLTFEWKVKQTDGFVYTTTSVTSHFLLSPSKYSIIQCVQQIHVFLIFWMMPRFHRVQYDLWWPVESNM